MNFRSNLGAGFRNPLAETVFAQKYKHEGAETWEELSKTVVEDVCQENLSRDDKDQLIQYIQEMKFIPGGRYLYYCSVPETQILQEDYTWKLAGDIQVEDRLVGFDEEVSKSRFKYTTVINVNRIIKPLYRINTTLGSVTVSDCHQFVGKPREKPKKSKHRCQWIAAKDLTTDWFLYFTNFPWEVDKSFEGGWISGILDGEGTVSKGSISISQNPGKVLDNIIRIFTEKNIKFTVYKREKDKVQTIAIKGRWESVKVLGMFRPLRLLENWYKQELGSFWSRIQPPAKVISIEYLGEGEVVAIETESKTLITNGFLSHNCGRLRKFYNSCYIFISEEDSREDWASLSWKAERCLTVGGGIGNCYSIYRPKHSILKGTGGEASGPVSKMRMINEIGREVIQGGSRRSAIYASLHHYHDDINEFLYCKDWYNIPVEGTDKSLGQLKEANFNFPCPLDMTNVSVNYDTKWLLDYWNSNIVGDVFLANCIQAMKTGEPGFSFNFFDKEAEVGRNACTEISTSDDSDVCNLGSLNLSRISSMQEFMAVTELATKFLICGTLKAELPYKKIYMVREKNRRLGLGLMGVHEWLIQRKYRYEVPDELKRWLTIYRDVSRRTATNFSNILNISNPIAVCAIAPTGSIGILAGTTTGIEPIYALAVKRRYLKGNSWKYQYTIDGAAKDLIDRYGIDPEKLESSIDLAKDYERRIKFQADVQDFVDMSISSTINLPRWGSEYNNEDHVKDFATTLARYCHRLRGFTVYPDGARGGQPLTSVPYREAIEKLGVELEENTETFDVCEITKTGYCAT